MTAANIAIRPAREDEFDEITRVWMASWESTGLSVAGDSTFEELRARIPLEIAAGWRLFVADADGKVAALLAVRLEDHHLDQLFVSPEFQGRGLGAQLLDFARSLMPREIWLRTSTGNVKARAWYEREGFVRERVEDRPEWSLPRAYYRWRASDHPKG